MVESRYRSVDRYILLDAIAQGAVSTVYRAFQTASEGLGRVVVLKLFKPDYLASGNPTEQEYRRQVQTMMNLIHTNVTQLFDSGQDQSGSPYLVMEYVQGRNLRNLLVHLVKNKSALKPEVVLYIGQEIARALQYAHRFRDLDGNEQPVLHRNLTPQNVLLSFDGVVKLIEFGLAPAQAGNLASQVQHVRGRSGYTPPEEVDGKVYEARSDLFSLGVILWEALLSRSLFTSDSRQQTIEKIRKMETVVVPPSSINPTLPKEVDVICMKLLAKDPKNRYASADEAATAIEKTLILLYPDFGASSFQRYVEGLFKTEMESDGRGLQTMVQEAEKIMISTPQNDRKPFLQQIRSQIREGGDQTRIMIGKQQQGANGARVLESHTGTGIQKVELERPSPQAQKLSQRGGYVKRLNRELRTDLSIRAEALREDSDDDASETTVEQYGVKGPSYSWMWQLALVIVALILFVLPHFGITLLPFNLFKSDPRTPASTDSSSQTTSTPSDSPSQP